MTSEPRSRAVATCLLRAPDQAPPGRADGVMAYLSAVPPQISGWIPELLPYPGRDRWLTIATPTRDAAALNSASCVAIGTACCIARSR